MKWQTIIFMIFVMVSTATAIPICENYIKPSTECRMVTPTITCATYNYSIINSTGSYIENKTLYPFDTNIYHFNFTEPRGEYIIKLCDGTTREIYVGAEDNNMLLGLILIPLVLGIMFLAASFFLSEEHTIFKIFLFGLSFISATASLYMSSVTMTYLDSTETAVQTAISNTMLWVSWVDYIIIIYIFVYVTIKILKALKQNNEDKLKY